nr:Chain C, Isocitrate dehydrogenase [NADP], mitochondrial [Homo sapiens]6UJ8_F Chain F, Isocitrate dehydrogenase [NADP], mitochondrial [Homo sapiens]
SPNGTIRNIL